MNAQLSLSISFEVGYLFNSLRVPTSRDDFVLQWKLDTRSTSLSFQCMQAEQQGVISVVIFLD